MTTFVKTAIIINLSAVEQQKITDLRWSDAGRKRVAASSLPGAMNLLRGRFCAWKNSDGGVFYSIVQVRGGRLTRKRQRKTGHCLASCQR
jgi:hypothetical protein